MLHQDIKLPDPLEPKNEVAFVFEAIYKKGDVFEYQRHLNAIMGPNLKTKRQSCLKNTTLRFEEQQQNIKKPMRPLWKLLTKSCQNCCFNQWMLRSFKALKKYRKFGSKI